MTDLDHSLLRLRASVLQPAEKGEAPALTVAELDALCAPAAEHVDEVILLCLLAARQYPSHATALSHVPWILSTMAINHPERLGRYLPAISGLLEAPAAPMRELATHLLGDWWQRGHREYFPCLLGALHDRAPAVVKAALTRLCHCGAGQAVEVLEHCGRAVEALDPGADNGTVPAVGTAETGLCTAFAGMALLLAKRGLVSEVLLRAFFSRLRGGMARLAVPEPVREWLPKPTGAMEELLAKYTEQELLSQLSG